MPSRAVLDSHRIAEPIIHAAFTHAEVVGEKLAEVFALVVPEGETPSDWVSIQRQGGTHLRLKLGDVVVADELNESERDDDKEFRRRRDDAAAALFQAVSQLRDGLSGIFGTETTSSLLGIAGATSRDPRTAYSEGLRILERLRDPAPELPRPRFASYNLDPDGLAGELQPLVDELGATLAEMDRENREADATLGVKNAALEAFDEAAGGVARLLRGLYQMAGMPHLAAKIRLTLPARSGRPSDEKEAPPETKEEPSTPSGPETRPPEDAVPGAPPAQGEESGPA